MSEGAGRYVLPTRSCWARCRRRRDPRATRANGAGYPLPGRRSGSGRTAALKAPATRLAAGGDGPLAGRQVLRLVPEEVVGGRRSGSVRELGEKASRGVIAAVDDLEVVLMLASPATDLDVRGAVRSLISGPEVLTVMTLDADFRSKLQAQEEELYGELSFVELPELPEEDLRDLGVKHAWTLSTEPGIGVPESLVPIAAGPRREGDRLAHPGLMLERLDHAATRARLRGAERAEREDLELGPLARARRVVPEKLRPQLRERIAGQDGLSSDGDRLGLTTADLDLRPHRPNGVFLFAGPTGVGKTALAKALAEAVSARTTT